MTLDLVAGKPETSQVTLHNPAFPGRPKVVDHVEQGPVHRHLREVLAVEAGGDGASELELASRQGVIAEERFEERGFAGAVGADESEYIATHERGRAFLHQRPVADANRRAFRGDHAVAATLRDLEAHTHRAVFADRRAEPRHALQEFASALGLLGVLAREVARDVVRFAGDLALLLVELALLREASLGALRHKR